MYADALLNHREWQKKCGIHLASSDSLMLALEKDKEKSKNLKRSCSAVIPTAWDRVVPGKSKQAEPDLNPGSVLEKLYRNFRD